MASSRRLPASYNTSTYGNATRDYTSLVTWEAATDINLVTAINGEVLECYDDAASFDDYVVLSGATANSSYFRVVKPALGEEHDGTPNNGVFFHIQDTNYAQMQIQLEEYAQFHDLIVSNTGATEGSVIGFYIRVNTNAIIGCIAYNITGGTDQRGISGQNDYTCVDCLCLNVELGIRASSDSPSFYNCTIVDCTTGFDQSGGTPIAKNCIADNNTTDWSGTWAKTTCLDSTDNVVFVNAAGDDFHLDETDTAARGNGTDLSADVTYAFDDDIDGEVRSAWDIGFDEYSVLGWIGKVCGITNPAKIMGISAANITKVNGV